MPGMPKQSAASRARLGADSSSSNGMEVANTEGEPTTKLTRRLFRDSADLVWMHVHLPFVRGLAHGTLAKETFQAQIGQDAHYLAAVANCYTLAQAKATLEGPTAFAAIRELLADCHEELSLHAFYAEDWDVDLEESRPSDATTTYSEFMIETAEGPQSLAHLLMVVWCGCRMWGFLGSQVARAMPDADNAYTEWVTTYSAPTYQEVPAKLEQLIEDVGHKVPYEGLLQLFRRALECSICFLMDLPGLRPVPPVRVLVVGWGACMADVTDLTNLQLAISTAVAAAGGEGAGAAVRKQMESKRDPIVRDFHNQLDDLVEAVLMQPRAEAYDEARLLQLSEAIRALDRGLVQRIGDARLLKGETLADLAKSGREAQARPGCARTLSRATARGVTLHVVTDRTTAPLVRATLAAMKVPLQTPGAPPAPPGSVTGLSSGFAQMSAALVHAPEGEIGRDGVATGAIAGVCDGCWGPDGPLEGLSEDASPPWQYDVRGRGLGPGSTAPGRSVYVGDSLGDIAGLLEADIGIVLGLDSRLRQVLRSAGVEVRRLVAAPLIGSSTGAGVLYEARSWYEVEAWLFGLSTQPRRRAAPLKISNARNIDPAEIDICKREDGSDYLLGAGSFGEVYKGVRRRVQEVAVKRLVPGTCHDEWLRRLQEEVHIMERVSFDRNIVQYYGACLNEEVPLLVMEYMAGGDLKQALINDEVGLFEWGRKGKTVALDIARGLHFLHSCDVVHRDLKTSNVLLTKEHLAKISDVGLACIQSGSDNTYEFAQGTFSYAAPEVILGEKCTKAVDVYSFGVVLWELVTKEQAVRGQLRDALVPSECPQPVADIIDDCLQRHPEKRPSAEDLFHRLQAT